MSEHSGQTDQVHEVELESAINQAMWDRPAASIGQDVEVLVYTHFVGDGSSIRITVRNGSGRRLDRFEGQVYGNRFRGTWTVSDRAEETAYFQAELRDHGLEEDSEEMEIIPPIEITNARWSQQEAQRGDELTLTADVTNVPDGIEAQIEIYQHDEDDAHDLITEFTTLVESNRVEAEWEFEYHGDTGDIPTEEESEDGYRPPEYFFRVTIWGVSADSGLLEFKDWIEVNLCDDAGNAIGEKEYVIHLADGQQRSGTLDEDGHVREEDLPPGRVTIEIPEFPDIRMRITAE
jgi:hypothetical protein